MFLYSKVGVNTLANKHFKVIKPTDIDQNPGYNFTVFLAGSIDQGKAVDWQSQITELLSDYEITVFNPRRDNWNPDLKQDISNDDFRFQVEWELDHLDSCDMILMYFDPAGQAPITLLELGLHATSSKLEVCCPDGYWRKGNVQVVCERFGIKLHNTLDEFVKSVKNKAERI